MTKLSILPAVYLDKTQGLAFYLKLINNLFSKYLVLSSLLWLSVHERGYTQSYTPLYNSSTFNRSLNVNLSVGATVGQAGVAPTGGATYSIPIVIPPGTNNVTPSVSIQYNSMNGNGVLGMGWTIAGSSLISRVPKSIYQDGQAGSVELNADDRFMLDGQRLIATSGTYGANGTIYATENQTFARITSYDAGGVSGTGWFKVELKDGTVMEYGTIANARHQFNSSNLTLYWLLRRVQYPNGNYIEYSYTDDATDRRISEINYTGSYPAGLSPYNKIKFDYQYRSDTNPVYESGIGVSNGHLLTKITITAESQLVRSYEFNYGFDDINSYLKEVVESGSDGSSLNSTIFKYGDLPQEHITAVSSAIAGQAVNLSSGDFNADGYTDLLAVDLAYTNNIEYTTGFKVYKRSASSSAYSQSYSTTFPTTQSIVNKTKIPNFYTVLANDFTGDGADDVVAAKIAFNGSNSTFNGLTIYQSNTDGYATNFTPIEVPAYPNFNIIDPSGKYIFPGDFNGDGVQDILTMLGTSGGYGSHMYLGGISSSFGTVGLSGSYNLGTNVWPTANHVYVLDFNGDGKSDLMVVKDYQCEIFTFDSYVGRRIYAGNFPNKDHLIYLGDFNGDRKTDLLVRASLTDNAATWSRAISTGKEFWSNTFFFQRAPNLRGIYSDDQLTIADFNGDGRTDVYHGWVYFEGQTASTSRLDMYYSRGENFRYVQHYFPKLLGFVGSLPFDANGDGRADLISRTNYQQPFDQFFFRAEGKEHLLEKVANGHGLVTEWNYKRLNQEAPFYSRSGLGNAPFFNMQAPLYAVAELKSPNGISGIASTQYSYEDAKLTKTGKGFMGFKKMSASNQAMGTVTVAETQFNDFPLSAAPLKTNTYLSTNGQLSAISEVSYTNEFVAYGGQYDTNKRFWHRVNSTTQVDQLAGTTTWSNITYDDYGNATQSTVNNNIETTTTTTTYGTYATPVPAKPTSVVQTKTRSGQTAYSVTTTFDYNNTGQLISRTEFSGLPKSVTTSYSYNNLGNVIGATVSPAGMASRSTSMTYDSKGRFAISATNQLGQTSSAGFDARWGNLLTETGIHGLTTTYEYDAFGRLKKTNLPQGYSVSQSHGWDSNHGAVYYKYAESPGKPDVKTWFDILGRAVRTETEGFGGQWIIQSTTYDGRGNVASSTQPYKSGEPVLTSTTSYDAYNRLASTGNDSFGTTNFSYSYSNGNFTVTTTNPAGQASSKVTDPSGQIISATDHGGTLNYTYNSLGKQITVVKDGITLTSSEYDAYGQQTKLIDQNAGTTTYDYNALGQLTSQVNATGQTSTLQYDLLGRNTSRQGAEGTTSNEYYGSGSGAATNQLYRVTSFAGNVEEYSYDAYGRVNQVKETVDGTDYTTTTSYNTYGDVTSQTFPSGLVIRHEYDGNGYPTYIRNGDNSVTLYTNNGLSGQGVNTSYQLGNGKSSTINHYYGMPTQYLTDGVQNLELSWNYSSGNLNQRKDNLKGRQENFSYDNLNRLTSALVAGQNAQSVSYGFIGNIDAKSDAGVYTYDGSRRNAVTDVTNPSGVIPTTGQTITYTAFSQPGMVTENGFELSYLYGSDYNRVRSITKQNGNEINRRYYFGEYEKDVTGGTTRHLHYISSPAGLIAIVVRENGSDSYYYTYTDHLGSILTVTNNSGAVVAEQSFDAWGRRRNASTWVPYASATEAGTLPIWLYRGYTGHEHLDQFGLINMNGRLYDPSLGRVLSPDNFVQDEFSTQSFNRFTYSFNNPLRYTDPDGNNPILIGAIFGGLSYALGVAFSDGGFRNWDWGQFIGSVSLGALTGGFAQGLSGATASLGSVGSGAVTGAVSGAIGGAFGAALAGGDFERGAWQGALFGGALGAIGGVFTSEEDYPLLASNDPPGGKLYYGGTLKEVIVRGKRLLSLAGERVRADFLAAEASGYLSYISSRRAPLASGAVYPDMTVEAMFIPILPKGLGLGKAGGSLGTGRTAVKRWLQNAGDLERSDLVNDIQRAGFKKVFDGKGMMHFERGGMKIRLDPPQGVTNYNHMHLNYGNKFGSYDINLNRVPFDSRAAHIPIK